MDEVSLRGKRALVCGASRGIGRACAVELARIGAEIVLLARDEAALREVQGGLLRTGGQAHRVVVADLGQPDTVHDRIGSLLGELGSIQILINNSGGPASGPVHEAEPEVFAPAFIQHVVAAQTLTRLLLSGMQSVEYGRVINIISTSVKQPIPGLGVSNTIRGAMASWAKTLATEVAGSGVTVNNVLPGATRTERLRSLIAGKAEREGKSVMEVERATLAAIPAGRFAEPEEIGRVVAFLASPDASYITGINLPVDGGRTLSL